MLSGGRRYTTWNAVYIPIIYWCLFLLCLRNRMALSFWETREHAKSAVPSLGSGQDEFFGYRHSFIQKIIPRRRYFKIANRLVLFFWIRFTAAVFLYLYTCYLGHHGNVHMLRVIDVPVSSLPGYFWTAVLCGLSFGGLFTWLSYLVSIVNDRRSKSGSSTG
jgi:hypothetical protein